jgi:hypothetical protein
MRSREIEVISLMEKVISKQNECLKLFNKSSSPKPISDGKRQNYVEDIRQRLM